MTSHQETITNIICALHKSGKLIGLDEYDTSSLSDIEAMDFILLLQSQIWGLSCYRK